jgi:hypothetical protein
LVRSVNQPERPIFQLHRVNLLKNCGIPSPSKKVADHRIFAAAHDSVSPEKRPSARNLIGGQYPAAFTALNAALQECPASQPSETSRGRSCPRDKDGAHESHANYTGSGTSISAFS